MTAYEYKVLPAPRRGRKSKGIKGAEARFSFALQEVINSEAAQGWQYQRAETLPSEERAGLTSHNMVWRHVLVFCRPRAQDAGSPGLHAAPALPAEDPQQDHPADFDAPQHDADDAEFADATADHADHDAQADDPDQDPDQGDHHKHPDER